MKTFKKMKFPAVFKKKQYWPSCKTPESLSSRSCNDDDIVFVIDHHDQDHNKQSAFNPIGIISGVRLSERLIFEPTDTSSILVQKEARSIVNGVLWPFKESVALELESENPYLDFKRSMQEMVESQLGMILLKDNSGINWDCLEDLLRWYLRLNGRIYHSFIVEAFVDLLIEFASNK